MKPASVTQIHGPRRATRLGPKEARTYVQRARAAGLITAPAARALFEHLLRVCDPRRGFVQDLPQGDQLDRGTGAVTMTGLTSQLGVSAETLRRANRALEASGLVRVKSGFGRSWSRYTLDAREITGVLGELPRSPWGNYPVNPGEDPTPETPHFVGSDPTNQGVRPHETPGQTPQNEPPYARARVHARESDRSKNNSPHPRDEAHDPSQDDSPPASGQGPLSDFEKCEHGRTPAQGGCRTCGTTRRQLAQRRADQDRDEQHRAKVAEQLAERERRQAERAAARGPDPELIAAARAGALAGKHHPPTPPKEPQ
ncbi:MAG: hypothetical protein JWQ32_2051 [Marmoricola sp.]|nr:hypothetical protein [Marmoricola sp.]